MAVGGNNSGGSSSGIKAGAAYVTLGVKDFLSRDLANAQRAFQNFGSKISSIGKTMALGGAAAFTPLIGAMGTLNDIAKQGSIAKSLGLTSEQFTGIAGVAKSVGNDTKEFIESLVTLGKLGTDAAAGTEQASQAFASMGLNANEFIKLRADEQFFKIFDALGAMENKQQSVRALMAAFGEDGGKILLPLLGKSADELRKMAAGFAITGDDMKAATGAQQAYTAATSALGKAWQSVSIAAAPIVKILAEGIAQAVTPFREFVNANREAVVGLSLAAGGVTAVGLGLMVLGPAIKALAGSWALFTGAVAVGKAVIAGTMAVIAAPILLIPAGLAAAGAAWLAFTDRGRGAAAGFGSFLSSMFGETWDNLKNGWSGVVAAISKGDLTLAFEIGTAAIEVEWVRLTNFMSAVWDEVKNTIAKGIQDIADEFEAAADLDKQFTHLTGGAVLEQKQQRGFIRAIGPSPNEIRQQGLDAAKGRLAGLMGQLDDPWADFGGGADFGAGFQGNPLAAQIAGIASQSRGSFGGSANVGMFGGGGVGEKIAENTKRTAIAVEKLSVGRYNEAMALTVEGGG